MKRRLVLTRETLTELAPRDLRDVVGGATVGAACGTKLTVLQYGCPSDPRICEYATDFC